MWCIPRHAGCETPATTLGTARESWKVHRLASLASLHRHPFERRSISQRSKSTPTGWEVPLPVEKYPYWLRTVRAIRTPLRLKSTPAGGTATLAVNRHSYQLKPSLPGPNRAFLRFLDCFFPFRTGLEDVFQGWLCLLINA